MPARKDRTTGESEDPQQLYSLVVIGASAGGIEALSTVLGSLSPTFSAPIVIAQHLDPHRPSHLAEILGRRSVLPVKTVVDRELLTPGCVYVVPADRHVEINDGHLRLLADKQPRPKPSIDLLLSSAAKAYGERLIGVILTGTGSDGASGAREVKVAGGTVVIENPETAAYPGMPASLAPTAVDLVADLTQIGPLLQELLDGASVGSEQRDKVAARDASLAAILAQVREQSGIDFSSYKHPTILRRLQRRLVATGARDLQEYASYLANHPEEYRRLSTSFLIKVTEFYRDAELFDMLRGQVLPDLVAHARAHAQELRMWSAGCATGEEAYSLAILTAETLGEELEQFQVQIFATDLDEEAVAFARRGIYPPEALAHLPEALVARYFTRLDGGYEVTKQLRRLIIFGQHDLGLRPPFPRIDLVLCRNVLIYFTQELQARVLQLFAFALRDGGYLALGKAETSRPLEAYFAPVQGSLKLYRRYGERVLAPIAPLPDPKDLMLWQSTAEQHGKRSSSVYLSSSRDYQPSAISDQPHAASHGPERARTTREWLGNLLLELPLGVVVVDRRYDVQAINSIALRLLGIYTAAQGEDLVHLTKSVPADSLRAAIDGAFRLAPETRSARAVSGLQDRTEADVVLETVLGERRQLHLSCYPYTEAAIIEGNVAGQEARVRPEVVLIFIEDVSGAVQAKARDDALTLQLRTEEGVRQEREKSDREHSLQLSVEENTRLKEEMSRIADINRSLLEANQDLSDTVLELRRTNEDLLVGHEEAQANAEEVKTLNEELQATNEELVTVNEELQATVEEIHASNDDLEARGRELELSSEALLEQRTASEAARVQLEAILLSLGDAVLVVDQNGTVVLTNTAYDAMFEGMGTGLAVADVTGRPLAPHDTPQGRAARGETFTMEFTIPGETRALRWFEASGQPIYSNGEAHGGVVAIRDITERSLHRLQDEFLALASHELRTPLTTITFNLQLLAKFFADQPEDSRPRQYATRALHQARQLTRLVDDLFDVRRLQSGGFRLDLDRVALDQVAMRAVEAAQTLTERHTIRLKLSVEPVEVEGDATRLEQVLLNLLTNAITYAPQSLWIDVSVRRMGNEAELQVQDYGGGIPAEQLPEIFSRFYQVTRTDVDRPSRRGLGLGLYIAHELVAAHGGRMEVTSIEGPRDDHGTTFTIHLPLAAKGEA